MNGNVNKFMLFSGGLWMFNGNWYLGHCENIFTCVFIINERNIIIKIIKKDKSEVSLWVNPEWDCNSKTKNFKWKAMFNFTTLNKHQRKNVKKRFVLCCVCWGLRVFSKGYTWLSKNADSQFFFILFIHDILMMFSCFSLSSEMDYLNLKRRLQKAME